MQEMVI